VNFRERKRAKQLLALARHTMLLFDGQIRDFELPFSFLTLSFSLGKEHEEEEEEEREERWECVSVSDFSRATFRLW